MAKFKAKHSKSYHGLTEEEARKRLQKYGYNILTEVKRRSILELILSQFKNHILILLLFAALISFLIGEEIQAFAILLAVFISIAFGVILEYKADESLEKLYKLTEKRVTVIRDGEPKLIPAKEVVPSDLLLLTAGSYIAGDAKVIEANNLAVDESSLTGESLPVEKAVGDKVFAGTYVVRGIGKAIVEKTGKQTEFGRLGKTLSEIVEEKTPLEKNLDDLGKKLSIFSIKLLSLLNCICKPLYKISKSR